MYSGGNLIRPVSRLIQKECRRTYPDQEEGCVEKVSQKTKETLEKICQPMTSRRCQKRLTSSVWTPIVQETVRAFKKRTMDNGLWTMDQKQETAHPLAILWEQPLSLLDDKQTHSKFKLTHKEEWRPVQTEIVLAKEAALYPQEFNWCYYLTQNSDGSYTLYWRQEKCDTAPTEQDKKIVFNLVEGHYPNNLEFAVEGTWENDLPSIKGLHLILK